MKRYIIRVEIREATGIQEWIAEANSKEAALKMYNDGECELDGEEFEAHELGEPEVIEEE